MRYRHVDVQVWERYLIQYTEEEKNTIQLIGFRGFNKFSNLKRKNDKHQKKNLYETGMKLVERLDYSGARPVIDHMSAQWSN